MNFLYAAPIDQTRDISMRIRKFQGKVDLIYVGTSGSIQPALPIISAEARKMNIPIFNEDSQAVIDGLAMASFGVSYKRVGHNAGKLVAAILKIKNVPPISPKKEDHQLLINKEIAKEFGVKISESGNIPSCINLKRRTLIDKM